ncbi:hypothetical protein KBD49_13335 [Myxococcota bacterium]|jgi:hypothetical protein|nr:hypothetical protein [Myxococcota bacterium]
MVRAWVILAAGLFLAASMGCGGAPSTKREFGKAPSWYNEPPKGCGVGSAQLRRSRQAARDAAVASARLDLVRSVQGVVQGMVRRYLAEGEAQLADFTEEQATSTVRDVVDADLMGARPVKTETNDEELFTLVCLDPETFGNAFERMTQLSQKARAALRARAQEEFKDLDEQIQRLRERQTP